MTDLPEDLERRLTDLSPIDIPGQLATYFVASGEPDLARDVLGGFNHDIPTDGRHMLLLPRLIFQLTNGRYDPRIYVFPGTLSEADTYPAPQQRMVKEDLALGRIVEKEGIPFATPCFFVIETERGSIPFPYFAERGARGIIQYGKDGVQFNPHVVRMSGVLTLGKRMEIM